MSKITSSHVRAALKARFCAPEWAILFEVLNATGAAHTRAADAIAMSLWPSRGLELWGMEIKVSRSDWLNERKQPQKAETIAAYCDRWYLVTAPNVVTDSSEVPPAWGWMTFDGKHLAVAREGQKTEAKPMDRRFLAALLRRADKVDTGLIEAEVEKRMASQQEDFDNRVKLAVERRTRDATAVLRDVEAFEAAAGIKISEHRGFESEPTEVGRAVAVLRKSGVLSTWNGLHALAAGLRAKAEEIEKAGVEMGFAQPAATPRKRA